MSHFIGVDVGTTSVRACIMVVQDWLVQVTHTAIRSIKIWNEVPDHYEQSSDDIWAAVSSCVKEVVATAKIEPSDINGIGFDATCSLVALSKEDLPISVSLSKDKTR